MNQDGQIDAEEWEQVEQTFQQASEVLGYDLWDIVSNGPEEKLTEDGITDDELRPVMTEIYNISVPLFLSVILLLLWEIGCEWKRARSAQ